MTAEEYVRQELEAGRLTAAHIAELVRSWQANHGLEVDGKPGPVTIAALNEKLNWRNPAPKDKPAPLVLHSPMPVLKGGRKAVVTSSYKPTDRPNHVGLDFFYRWVEGDQPNFVGDKGCAGKTADGKPKWVVPYFTPAIAAAAGRVQIAGKIGTGYRCWIDHGNGWRTGYFHLQSLHVRVGDTVKAGDVLGLIGDNPQDHDGRHLHFELSPVDRYAPVDPAPYLK